MYSSIMSLSLTENKSWDQLWKKWLRTYNSGSPRFSYYIHIILNILLTQQVKQTFRADLN